MRTILLMKYLIPPVLGGYNYPGTNMFKELLIKLFKLILSYFEI